MDELKALKLHQGPAKCALDLGDGSERGEYVNQDYILRKLGRPHRAITLMYCYYPLDAGWPGRASVVHAHDDVSFAWDYPYDDYFPYTGGLNGSQDSETFEKMQDVRRHGQDVLLTLTVDPNVSDDHLIAIAKDLRPYGRVLLRLNHEATGSWFSFNKRCTYKEVADFFVHASEVIREHAPNVQTIICIGGIEEEGAEKMVYEEEFAPTIKAADIWSVDKYMSLHWGWPYDVAETGGNSHKRSTVKFTYDTTRASFERYKYLNNGAVKPMVMSEFNSDGDVVGPYDQCSMMKEFVDMLKADKENWLKGISFYQFRDEGRLGLEIQDPNNKGVGIEQPLLEAYKRDMLNDPYFMPTETVTDEIKLPATLRWGNSEDADGLAIPVKVEKDPHYFEAYFDGELADANLMMEINGMWFYKAPGVKCIDLMSAFFNKKVEAATEMTLKLFAPPASGKNDETQGADWATNYYYEIKSLPRLRILYGPVEV